jgi:hypothetical protein
MTSDNAYYPQFHPAVPLNILLFIALFPRRPSAEFVLYQLLNGNSHSAHGFICSEHNKPRKEVGSFY